MRLHFPPLLAASLFVGLAATQATDAGASGVDNASSTNIRLFQRIFHPSRPSEPFVDRGAIELAYRPAHVAGYAPTSANFAPAEELTMQAYVAAYVASLQESGGEGELGPVDLESAVYQLALEHPGDTQSSQWHVSSVKVVRLISSKFSQQD
jgi:ER membrane protein complex subunit 10